MNITDGNDVFYSLENTNELPSSALTGKTFYFLGSSVTLGAGAMAEGMGDFIAKRNGCKCIKEAVSSTTLADVDDKSYVRRLENYIASTQREASLDAFICQLSTNDASKLIDLGEIAADDVTDLSAFDKITTFGAIEYIIALCKKTWNCPVVFYTGSAFQSPVYENMICGLNKIAKKWDICVLDLFYDKEFNNVTKEQYELYMLDPIHPKRAGYRDWWVPAFERCLRSLLSKRQ